MSRLIKGMYGSEFHRESNLFGLSCGQMRTPSIAHNASWYNKKGEKLGWGDLGPKDALRIIGELENGEFIVVVGEYDSYWNLKREMPHLDDYMAPGVDYVVNKMMYMFGQGCIVVPHDKYYDPSTVHYFTNRYGLPVKVMTHEEIKQLLTK